MRAMFDVLQKRLELRAAMIFQLKPTLGASPRLVGSDVAALDVCLRRPASEGSAGAGF